MNTVVKNEIKSIRNIKARSDYVNSREIASFIDCCNRKTLCVDVYSWERAIAGISNDGLDWDVDQHYEKMLVIPFEQDCVSFHRAFRLARLCVGGIE